MRKVTFNINNFMEVFIMKKVIFNIMRVVLAIEVAAVYIVGTLWIMILTGYSQLAINLLWTPAAIIFVDMFITNEINDYEWEKKISE
jgi:hypothetical protein